MGYGNGDNPKDGDEAAAGRCDSADAEENKNMIWLEYSSVL